MFPPRSVTFSVRRKVAQFSDFGLFSLYKTRKKYLPVISLQPRGYIAKWLRFFDSGVFLRLLVGELGTPKLAEIFAYDKWAISHTECYYTGRQIWTKYVLKRAILRTDVYTFPPNIVAPTPKITPKPYFGGPFKCKTYYTEIHYRDTL